MKILFVCTGNTCRSAMAAAMMADIAEKNDLDVLIDSAGVFAEIGEKATPEAIRAMERRGIDLTAHRTKPLTDELIDMADLILVMTSAHKLLIEGMAKGKAYTLLEYAGSEGDISDPYGGDDEEYEATASEIYDALVDIAEKLPVEK
ncbi:MAG: low molecular weight protein arginine phosphatase [Clostridia bacterium]|nr:low molecular weight protein arginine phosphatase [Clostridia bacterium]